MLGGGKRTMSLIERVRYGKVGPVDWMISVTKDRYIFNDLSLQGVHFESVVFTSTCELMQSVGNTKIGVKLVSKVVIFYVYYTNYLYKHDCFPSDKT